MEIRVLLFIVALPVFGQSFGAESVSPLTTVFTSPERCQRWQTARTRTPLLRWINPEGVNRTELLIAGRHTTRIEFLNGEEVYLWRIASENDQVVEENVYTLTLRHYRGEEVICEDSGVAVVVNGVFTPAVINFTAETSKQSKSWCRVGPGVRVPIPCDAQWHDAENMRSKGMLAVERDHEKVFDAESRSSQWILWDFSRTGGAGSYDLSLVYSDLEMSEFATLQAFRSGLLLFVK